MNVAMTVSFPGSTVSVKPSSCMVINGVSGDKAPLVSQDLIVENCDSYTYLSAVFTQDGSIMASVKEHVIVKQAHLMKFVALVTKNADFPFWVKRKVLDAALLSSVLYSCESWLGRGGLAIGAIGHCMPGGPPLQGPSPLPKTL